MQKQNNKGAAHKLANMPLLRLHLQKQKDYFLNQKIQKKEKRINHRSFS